MGKLTSTTGKAGLYRRPLMPKETRKKAIQRINKIPEEKRTADHWWEIGENTVLNGLLQQDESLVSDGMKWLKKATQANPPSVAAFMDLAWLLMHRHLDMFALEYLEQATKLTIISRDLYAMLALCHSRLGNRELALKAVTRATLSAQATSFDYQLKTELENIESDAYIELARNVQLLKINPQDAFDAGFPIEEIYEIIRLISDQVPNGENNIGIIENSAEVDYLAKDYVAARQRLKRIVLSNEATAKSYVLLGLMAFKESDLDVAEQHYFKALELDPENHLAIVNYTTLRADKNDYAEDVVNRLIWAVENPNENDPKLSAIALTNLGNYYAAHGDFKQDIELQEASLRLYSDEKIPTPINLFATLLNLGRINRAEVIFEKYRKNFKHNDSYELAKMLLKMFKAAEKNPLYTLEIGFEILNSKLPLFNEHSLIPIVENAFEKAKQVPRDQREDFYLNLGYLSNAAGNKKISAECWNKLSLLTGNKRYYMNYAIDLLNLGEKERAGLILKELPDSALMENERTCSMSAVIYKALGQYSEARAILEKGLDISPTFSLLYSNLIGLAQLEEMRDSQQEILKSIIDRIDINTDNYNLRYFRGIAESLMGLIASAADQMLFCFFNKEESLNYQQMRQRDALKDETDVSDCFDIYAYKDAAKILYRAGRLSECQKLMITMRADSKLADGDSLVGLQTIARRSPDVIADKLILEGMGPQVPVLIELAIIAINDQDTLRAQEYLEQINQIPNSENYNHLEGKSQALVKAICAHCQYYTGHAQEALQSIKEAIIIDNQVPFVYETLIDIGGIDKIYKISNLIETRMKGSPWLKLRELSYLVEIGDFGKAVNIIKDYKSILTPLLPEGRYQSLLEAIVLSNTSIDAICPEWIEKLTKSHYDWNSKAYQLMKSGYNEAALIYLFKWLEDLMNMCFISFKERYASECYFDRDTPFSSFISGGNDKMNLGAMIKTLSIGLRPAKNQKPEQLIISFLQHKSHTLYMFLNHKGVDQLMTIAQIRNCLMHTTPVDPVETLKVRRLLLTDEGNIGEVGVAFS